MRAAAMLATDPPSRVVALQLPALQSQVQFAIAKLGMS